jgi:hypothetical protein
MLFDFSESLRLLSKGNKKKCTKGGQPDESRGIIIFNPMSKKFIGDEHAIGEEDCPGEY